MTVLLLYCWSEGEIDRPSAFRWPAGVIRQNADQEVYPHRHHSKDSLRGMIPDRETPVLDSLSLPIGETA